MKISILALIGLIGVAAAAVVDNVDTRKDGSAITGNTGTRRISQMSLDDLLHQKFLLDILQHVQKPNVSQHEISQVSGLQTVQLVEDQFLYIGGVDGEMAHVLKLSRNQDLLAKDEVYTIADDEHIRQMIGLYRLLVRSRDWDTLQRNLLYARTHVNGVLLVNSMLLAIRDRDDTQNLVMPGINEILPELYLDEELLRRAKEIHLQSDSAISVNRRTQRPGILEMIGLNKLWNIDANRIDTLDRRQLWMPWREMHMEIQARKVGDRSTPTRIRDDRIVLPVTLPTRVLREDREARLLSNDVGLQSFLQSLINELCLTENESMQQYEQWSGSDANRAVLGRVSLERNVGSMLESEIGHNTRQVLPVDNYETDFSQIGWDSSRVNVRLPTTTADDERLLYVNRKRQRAAAINQMYFRGEQPEREFDLNRRWAQTGVNQVNKRDTIHNKRFDVNDVGNREHRRVVQHIDFGQSMPMDWNRQMAMHRQKKNRMIDTEIKGNPTSVNIGDKSEAINIQVPDLPEVDITNERLLHVGRRRLNQWKKESQQQESVLNKRHNTDIYREDWENPYQRQDARSEGSIVEDPRIWTTVARGMGNIGIHVGQKVNEQNEINTGAQQRNTHGHNQYIPDTEGEAAEVEQHRAPRSLVGNTILSREGYGDRKREGELLLHNLQQLMARLNLEYISLGLRGIHQLQDDTMPVDRFNNARLSNAMNADQRLVVRLNTMRLNSRRSRILINRINEVERRLEAIIENEIQRGVEAKKRNDIRSKGVVDQLIGDILIGKQSVDQGVNFLNILREIILHSQDINGGFQKLNQITMDLENPVVLHLLRRIVQIADLQRQQQLGSYRTEELLMDGVSINDVSVDKLRSYVDTNDVDLINAVDVRTPLTPGRNADVSQRMVVARQQRLNHQAFTVNLVVTANGNKRVVVRTILVPKTVASDLGTQLKLQRQNFILLDTYMTDLHSGRNVITRNSEDIDWTARDTTPFSEIYKRVMQALDGDVDITVDQVQGQICRFPHRLLLPRGRVEGLPMQMLVIITPVETDWRPTVQQTIMNNKICGIGMGSMNLDYRPLGFPLDRPTESIEVIGSLPNAHLMDVEIFHSKQLVADDFY